MRIIKNKTLYSPTDLNNFVSCKYHIKNDLLAEEKKIKDKGTKKIWMIGH